MKRVMFFAILLFTSPVFADDFSIAGKGGYHWFKTHRDSVYEHNHINDNEWFTGGYVRYGKDWWFIRTDYDQIKTGDELDSFFGPYEGVHETLRFLMVGPGIRWKWAYAGVSAGLGFHTFDILTYEVHPAEADYRPSLAGAVYIGAEKKVHKNVYLFSEVRYLYNKQRINARILDPGSFEMVSRFELNEDFSGVSVLGGVGVRF